MQHGDQDDHDHDHHKAGRGQAHRALAPPELGVGPIAGVVALGRGTHPIIVVVIRAHPTSL